MEVIRRFSDIVREGGGASENLKKYKKDAYQNNFFNQRVNSLIRFFNDETGEEIFEPLHNITTISGSALTAMKLFGLDTNVLDNTPNYDKILNLDNGCMDGSYPTMSIVDKNGDVIGSVKDETQRVICGFCVGQGGGGLDISDVFEADYCSWIEPDMLVPFRYPLASEDCVPELYYKGKAKIELPNNQIRNAYYFKEFSNTPQLKQSYVSTVGSFSDNVTADKVYSKDIDARAQSYIELHLKITKDDCREFYIAHKGLENARINQLSLVYGWRKTVEVTKKNVSGNTVTEKFEYMQDVRPFSLLNFNGEGLADLDKSISMIYTLYF